jgi:D-ribose pyranose/furanose isomerase RbsD
MLMSDKDAMKNVVAFLDRTDTASVIDAVLPIPLLPSNELILADAEFALDILGLKHGYRTR